jgi:hypothetical protein
VTQSSDAIAAISHHTTSSRRTDAHQEDRPADAGSEGSAHDLTSRRDADAWRLPMRRGRRTLTLLAVAAMLLRRG